MVSYATAGVDPRIMGIRADGSPIPESIKKCRPEGLNDIDLIELNEAFAAPIISSCKRIRHR